MRQDVAFVYVRELIERMTGTRPEPDQDGDLPVHLHGAQFFVRVVGPVNPWVQVFSVAVADLQVSPQLLTMLNEINTHIHFARAFHVGSQVIIESEIWAEDVTPANFVYACQNVAAATDAFAPRIVEALGGRALFEESKTDAYQQTELPLGPLGARDMPPLPEDVPPPRREASPYL
jgi:hypothetical protein